MSTRVKTAFLIAFAALGGLMFWSKTTLPPDLPSPNDLFEVPSSGPADAVATAAPDLSRWWPDERSPTATLTTARTGLSLQVDDTVILLAPSVTVTTGSQTHTLNFGEWTRADHDDGWTLTSTGLGRRICCASRGTYVPMRRPGAKFHTCQHLQSSADAPCAVCVRCRWATCVRAAANAMRASSMPPESCERYRHRLEECTQRQTSLLLRTALLPPSPDWPR